MGLRSFGKRLFVVCLAWAALAACPCRAATQVLFVGNSYTYFNGGLDKQLEGLAPSIRTARVVAGGYTLERHWADGRALQKIRAGGWDYVVLQEQSQAPILDRVEFRDFARKFAAEIRTSGARTLLLMTWERPDSVAYGVTTENLAAAYSAVGGEVGAQVAPAGLAFARALRGRPELSLYSRDGHPTVAGSYLAACVLYAAIYRRSPVGNPYSADGISPQTSGFLQRMAAEAAGY